MRALVVYESMFGNTEAVARAVAEGLARTCGVEVANVATSPVVDQEVDLVVVGGPTHAFSMTRQSTRTEAGKQGSTVDPERPGIREWLDGLGSRHVTARLVTFDTRVAKVRHLPGSAAKSAARTARRHGLTLATSSESFYVDDVQGPLLSGELERALAWGSGLASFLAAPTP